MFGFVLQIEREGKVRSNERNVKFAEEEKKSSKYGLQLTTD